MDHKGVRYELLQSIDPFGWKWVAHISHTERATGFSRSRELAVHAASKPGEPNLLVDPDGFLKLPAEWRSGAEQRLEIERKAGR